MNEHGSTILRTTAAGRRRVIIVASLILVVAAGHWWTPRGESHFLVLHVLMRKLFILPVLLAAIWFDVRGAALSATAVMLFYVPHVLLQWAGEWEENVNQIGEVATVWITACIAGVLVRREKTALVEKARAYYGAVRALVAALDTREHDTGQHSERVCRYALRIAAEMELADSELRALELGALLHDIGKIGIPDAVLLKPGGLSDDEWRLMREHPELGARILRATPFLREAVVVVKSHHERFDGSGYPCGLAGEEIPLLARVFAVADVFDAITSTRPYHEAIPEAEAVREIEKSAGSHFDPQIVEAFRRIPKAEWRELRSVCRQNPAGDRRSPPGNTTLPLKHRNRRRRR